MDFSHDLLRQQLKRHFCGEPVIAPEWGEFLAAVGAAYAEFDAQRNRLERALEVHSAELREASERKRAEEPWRQAVSLLQSTLESTEDGLLVVDNDGKIRLFNKRFARLWNLPPEILQSRDDAAALAHVLSQVKDPDAFLGRIRELYANTTAESLDTVEFKDGRVFERYSRPQQLDGVPVGRVWSFRDISERKRLEDQLRQSQKMEAFGQLAAGVAHDFNNLLTVIQCNLSLLRTGGGESHRPGLAIDNAIAATERAANLTRQLLTFSRRQPLQPRSLDLNDIVASTTQMLQRLLGEHIALEASYAPGSAPVQADPGMMEQLLMNLSLNARDAMPAGGRLTIRTATTDISEAQAILVAQARAGTFCEISVTDTGSGIAPEHLPHIFEPFFTTKEIGKGTGLGLATVFGIVQQHQGWIQVRSFLDHGTTFRVFLPRSAVTDAPEECELREPPAALQGGESILLVEDEAAVRELLTEILARQGYQVHQADSGVGALKEWERCRNSISLLVTDMVMPGGIGGRELAQRLLHDKPGLKVLYCSGYSDDMLGPNSPLRSRRNFLEKPFAPQQFLERVRVCLDEPADVAER